MPYSRNSDLPDSVKHVLPSHGLSIFREAFNHAWEEYKSPSHRRIQETHEEVCFKVAWAAVKKNYKKQGEKWVERK
jgi:cation transport regulator